jgi:hypothetical protein
LDNTALACTSDNHCPPGVYFSTEYRTESGIGDQQAFIGNINVWMMGFPFPSPPVIPVPLNSGNDFDRGQTNAWIEYNVSPNLNLVTPEATTDCGDGAGSCLDDGASYKGKNYLGSAAPVAWSAVTIPDSLYLAKAPAWWCQEACDFGQGGIGALGDDLEGVFCKLPAQIRYEDGVCTPMDGDEDGVPDSEDNCLTVSNAGQGDTDLDGYGNICDADYDDDGSVTGTDYSAFQAAYANPPTPVGEFDHDCDGAVAGTDYGIFKLAYGAPPGASGLACAGTVPCPATAHGCP